MKDISRKHHYISEFYLNGFAENEKKNPQITVIDKNEKRKFKTTAEGLANIRDFNRVEIEGKRPDFVETELSKFEKKVSNAIRFVHESCKFDGENRALILELIAMFSGRNPSSRQNNSDFLTNIYMNSLHMMVRNNNEMKEKLISELKTIKPEKEENISEEDIKGFLDDIKVEIHTEHHIVTESNMIINIAHLLDQRKWTLLQASLDTGPFITSDSPVVLCWENPDEVPAMCRNSPGFGMPNTILYFPLSKKLALIGQFEGEDAIASPNKTLVAVTNTMQILYSKKQLYMPNIDFYFLTGNEGIQKGERLLS